MLSSLRSSYVVYYDRVIRCIGNLLKKNEETGEVCLQRLGYMLHNRTDNGFVYRYVKSNADEL